jgi:hypothetical protein
MQYDPNDANEQKLIAKGEYDFEVVSAEDTVWENEGESHQQIKITLRVFHGEHTSLFSVWLGFPKDKLWKLKQFCEAVGLNQKWESGELSAVDCLDKAGKLKMDVWTGKTDGKERNAVRKFLPAGSPAPQRQAPPAQNQGQSAPDFYNDIDNAQKSDDIPF